VSVREIVGLAALAFVVACGPGGHATPTRAVNQEGRSEALLDANLEVSVARDVTFSFRVVNKSGRRLELRFPSGQTYDLAVLDSAGREIWRWSAGRMFTQALQTRVLDRGDTLVYRITWEPGAWRGRFSAVAELLSETHRIESRAQFAIP
jgi:hypothetical protein